MPKPADKKRWWEKPTSPPEPVVSAYASETVKEKELAFIEELRKYKNMMYSAPNINGSSGQILSSGTGSGTGGGGMQFVDPSNFQYQTLGNWTTREFEPFTNEKAATKGAMRCIDCKRADKDIDAAFMLDGCSYCEDHFTKRDALSDTPKLIV